MCEKDWRVGMLAVGLRLGHHTYSICLLFLYRSVDMDHDKDKVKNHFHYIHPYYNFIISFKIILHPVVLEM